MDYLFWSSLCTSFLYFFLKKKVKIKAYFDNMLLRIECDRKFYILLTLSCSSVAPGISIVVAVSVVICKFYIDHIFYFNRSLTGNLSPSPTTQYPRM